MAKQLQLRRGTTAQHSTFTGAVGEITVDTDKDVVVVHDGSTTGGFPLAKQSTTLSGYGITNAYTKTEVDSIASGKQATLVSGTNIKTINSTSLLGSGDISVAPLASPTFTGTVTLPSTTSIGNVSATEIGYVDGVTSAIQTQIDGKVIKVSSTDNAIVRFDGTSGAVQNSSVVIDDSGNVGIGTSSPGYKLDVQPSANGTSIRAGNGGYLSAFNGDFYASGSASLASSGVWTAQSSGASVVAPQASGNILFYTNTGLTSGNSFSPTERMRIDSSGNVGIGVTPSAWNNSFRVQDISSYGSLFSYTNGQYTGLTNNAYFSSSGWLYKNSFYATMYHQGLNGQHQWFTAPSGTAGNAITFTQAMTLGSNGNLLVGTTTDNGLSKLQVNGGIQSGYYRGTTPIVILNNDTSTSNVDILLNDASGTAGSYVGNNIPIGILRVNYYSYAGAHGSALIAYTYYDSAELSANIIVQGGYNVSITASCIQQSYGGANRGFIRITFNSTSTWHLSTSNQVNL